MYIVESKSIDNVLELFLLLPGHVSIKAYEKNTSAWKITVTGNK